MVKEREEEERWREWRNLNNEVERVERVRRGKRMGYALREKEEDNGILGGFKFFFSNVV